MEALTHTDSPSLTKMDHDRAATQQDVSTREATSHELASAAVDFEDRGSTLHRMSKHRKMALLVVVCCSQFLTIALLSSLFIANPTVFADLGLLPTNALWVIASFTLTLAGFLPFGGRLSDLYCPRNLFCSSLAITGCLTLGTSFFHDYRGLLVFRGLTGISCAVNTPAGITLLIFTFHEPTPQAHALNMFGLAAALGDVIGLVFTGVIMLIGPKDWHWVPRIGSFVSIPLSVVAWFILPKPEIQETEREAGRWRRIDLVGAASFTTGLVLFIFSLTYGVAHGWRNTGFILTLLLSILLFIGFLIWELRLPPSHALLQVEAFTHLNFVLLLFMCLTPFNFFAGTQSRLGVYYIKVQNKSEIETAAMMLPQAVTSLIVGGLPQVFPIITRYPRWVVPLGSLLAVAGLLLIIFSDGVKYWRFMFPGFIVGSAGVTLILVSNNTALIQTCPPHLAGFAGAITNAAFLIGAMTGLVIATGVSNAVSPDLSLWKSTAGGFWFILAWCAFAGIVFTLLYDPARNCGDHKGVPKSCKERMLAEESGGKGTTRCEEDGVSGEGTNGS